MFYEKAKATSILEQIKKTYRSCHTSRFPFPFLSLSLSLSCFCLLIIWFPPSRSLSTKHIHAHALFITMHSKKKDSNSPSLNSSSIYHSCLCVDLIHYSIFLCLSLRNNFSVLLLSLCRRIYIRIRFHHSLILARLIQFSFSLSLYGDSHSLFY